MRRNDTVSRRTVVQLAGATASTVVVAGCLGDGNGDDTDTDPDEWEDVDEILLAGEMSNWTGVSPEPIDGVENPTLVLFEGREYDITWENIDGIGHNIQMLADGDVLEETEMMNEEGETQTLTVEATSEMDEYVCRPHSGMMVGDIEVYE